MRAKGERTVPTTTHGHKARHSRASEEPGSIIMRAGGRSKVHASTSWLELSREVGPELQL